MRRAPLRPRFPFAILSLALLAGACRSGAPTVGELESALAAADADEARREALEPGRAVLAPAGYRGPGVVGGDRGPAPFVRPLLGGFRPSVAMAVVEDLDRRYRAPASPDFDEALDLVADALREGGYDGSDARFELRWLASEPVAGWAPRAASVTLHAGSAEPRRLHGFDDPSQSERVLLPIHAPPAHVRGTAVLTLEGAAPGSVLVTEAPLRQVLGRAEAAGIAAVLSASLGHYNVDPTGADRHLDAIQYRKVAAGTELAVAQISRRSYQAIADAVAAGGAEIELIADVEHFEAPLRTLVALIHGRKHPTRAVAVAAHVDEPGAGDNASGVATLLEGAITLCEAIGAGRVHPPDTTLAFLFGEEFRQSEMFLEKGGFDVIAGLSADMTGQSYERTGAIALLERGPDPGALVALPPDEHSTWGQSRVEPGMETPNGLAVIARCALIDVARREADGGRPWPCADHPWEGGSDHDVFLRAGVPAALFWHFTDFTYHTSLDRADMIDGEEMRRTGAAILATAMAVASAQPRDLERYVDSLHLELQVRLMAATKAGDPVLVEAWRHWGAGARSWLRKLCLDLEVDEAAELLETALPTADG